PHPRRHLAGKTRRGRGPHRADRAEPAGAGAGRPAAGLETDPLAGAGWRGAEGPAHGPGPLQPHRDRGRQPRRHRGRGEGNAMTRSPARDARIRGMALIVALVVLAYLAGMHWWFTAPMLAMGDQIEALREQELAL